MPDIIADKYEVLETIGRGGMGTVYKARQRNLDRIVAIKMLSEELASDPEFRARFQQEATVVARLNHPNIVQVHDIETHQNTFCIIMEYVDGENLQAKIDRDVTLSEKEVVAIGAQVSRALAYAHSKGIIHRDIKPDNIHVTPKGVAKVMDFGIARFLDSKLKTQTGISMGTPKFMSPEQVTGKNVDGQTDLYSLGICLYYCLAGRPPFDGENAISVATRHLYEQPEPPSRLNPSISPAVEAVVLKALEKQKASRYGTGVEMAEALESVLGTRTPVRAGVEADEVYAGATRKMPSQGYSSGLPTPAPLEVEDESGYNTPVPRTEPAAITPSRSIPELDPDFRTPRGDLTTGDPTRSFRLSLIFFGALVFFAVLLLILLVIWLQNSNSGDNALTEFSNRSITPVERLNTIDVAADKLVADGQLMEARRRWLDFLSRNPDVEPARVASEVSAIETRLPLAQSKILAERRQRIGRNYFNQDRYAMASAYLNAAVDLFPQMTTGTYEQPILQRSLSVPPTPDNVQEAQESFSQAQAQMDGQVWNTETLKLLISAVTNDYTKPQYWKALGDFFSRTDAIDDARVMYGEALKKNPDPALSQSIRQALDKIQ